VRSQAQAELSFGGSSAKDVAKNEGSNKIKDSESDREAAKDTQSSLEFAEEVGAKNVKKHVEGMKKRPTDTVRRRKLRVSVWFLPLVTDRSGIRNRLLHECNLKSNLSWLSINCFAFVRFA